MKRKILKRKTIVISLILITAIGAGPGSIVLFSNEITENISRKVAEKFLLENYESPIITFLSSEKCGVFNCWIFHCIIGSGWTSPPPLTATVPVKWNKITEVYIHRSHLL